LNEVGDFKLMQGQYEKLLWSAGFSYRHEKIGPRDREDVGGVWVYTAQLREPV